MNKGIIYITYGEKSIFELNRNLRKFDNCDILVINKEICNKYSENWKKARYAKTSLYKLSPFDFTIYLDADTQILSNDFEYLFDILEDGFDFCISASDNQAQDKFWHIGEKEKRFTYNQLTENILQLQAGVFSFRKNERVKKFFHNWKREWLIFEEQDQAAFVRALYKSPMKLFLTSKVFNNGTVIKHNFGKLR